MCGKAVQILYDSLLQKLFTRMKVRWHMTFWHTYNYVVRCFCRIAWCNNKKDNWFIYTRFQFQKIDFEHSYESSKNNYWMWNNQTIYENQSSFFIIERKTNWISIYLIKTRIWNNYSPRSKNFVYWFVFLGQLKFCFWAFSPLNFFASRQFGFWIIFLWTFLSLVALTCNPQEI